MTRTDSPSRSSTDTPSNTPSNTASDTPLGPITARISRTKAADTGEARHRAQPMPLPTDPFDRAFALLEAGGIGFTVLADHSTGRAA